MKVRDFLIVCVRGSGDIGSAVAHRLLMLGAKVIVHDESAPAHPRRGMAFADALFDGRVDLNGVGAELASDMDALLLVAAVCGKLPVCTLPLKEIQEHFAPDVVVDARMRKRASIEDQRALAPTVVGLGPGFVVGVNCTVAIETAWGDRLGAVVRTGGTTPQSGEPRQLEGVGRERFVYAPIQGIWRTPLQIGDTVSTGQIVGDLDGHPVHAPLAGTLRGLSHDAVTIKQGQKIVEVDPRVDAQVFGLGERPQAIARGVSHALGLDVPDTPLFFGFESIMEHTLECIPMSVRMKLDLCGFKVPLNSWRALPTSVRQLLLEASCSGHLEIQRYGRYLSWAVKTHGLDDLKHIQCGLTDWQRPSTVPAQLLEALDTLGLPVVDAKTWAELSALQRFALLKLSIKGHTRNLRLALEEFLTPVVAP